MTGSLRERCYSAADITRLVGVSYRQIDWWTTKGYILTADGKPNPGYGNARTYSAAELVSVARIQALLDAGFRLKHAARLASPHRPHWETA